MFGAVDIGGTKTLLGVFSGDGKLIKKVKFPTPVDYSGFQSELKKQVDNLQINKFLLTAVAVPGIIDRSHGIGVTFGTLTWQNVQIRDYTEKVFHSAVVIENDAKLAGLSEARELKGAYKKVLYLTISTGIGGGYIVNGQIDHSLEDNEVGHILLEHDGRLMRWQDFASGSAIHKSFGKKVKDITDRKEIYTIARNIGLGLIDLIATLTPDIVVIGGGVGEHLEVFKDQLEEELKLYKNNMIIVPPIVKAKRSEEAVIYGCYLLAKSNHEKTTY